MFIRSKAVPRRVQHRVQKRFKFPHFFNYPQGYEHLKGRTTYGRKVQFTKEEIEAVHVIWGIDKIGLITAFIFMMSGAIFLSLYPSKLRMERQTLQMQKNWVSLNRDRLIDTPFEKYTDLLDDEE